jgi:NTE family protein
VASSARAARAPAGSGVAHGGGPGDRPARPRRPPRARPQGRIGLALAGGGFLGAAYELGALAALSESIDGLDFTRLDVYVGVSAGSFVAAGLANGISPHRMIRLFIESEDVEDDPFDPATLLRPAWSELAQRASAAPAVLVALLGEVRRGLREGVSAAAWRGIDRASVLLPTGVVDATPAEVRMARLLSAPGRSNHFDRLRAQLRIVATDIDTGEAVAFGSPGLEQVPISRAVVASATVPGLFPPVKVLGRYFVDGALNKTLHASIALQEGAQLVICLNPLVPYRPDVSTGPRSVTGGGLGAVLAQTVRTAIRSRMTVGMQRYRTTHPDADVLLFEPRGDDAATFFTRIFSVASRRRLCEHAYRRTREDLLARAGELAPVLARHGLALNVRRLRGPGLELVRGTPHPLPRRQTRLAAATRRLRHTLDDLERLVRLSD